MNARGMILTYHLTSWFQ